MRLINRKFSCLILVFAIFAGFADFANAGAVFNKLKYVRDIEIEKKAVGIAAVSLDKAFYEHTEKFSDVRIIGATEEELPFRIRKQFARKKEIERIVCSSKILSLKKLDDNRIEIVIQNRDQKHTPRFLTIRTPNLNYDKKVSIANGSSQDKWGAENEEQAIFDYSAIIDLSNNTVSLPKGKGKYYKIVIANFSELKQSKRMQIIEERREGKDFSEIKKKMQLNDEFKIDRLTLEAEDTVYKDKAAVTRKVETDIISNKVDEKEKKTVVIVDVFSQPIIEIAIETESKNFSRNINIFSSNDREKWNLLTHGKIAKIDIGNYQKSDMKVNLPESRCRYLKMEIENGDAPALQITEANCFEAVYHAEFLLPDNNQGIKIYYGGALPPPQYDIEEILAKLVNPKYADVKLGLERTNSSYSDQPEEKSIFESKILMYFIIGIMVLVLGGALLTGMKKIEDVDKD